MRKPHPPRLPVQAATEPALISEPNYGIPDPHRQLLSDNHLLSVSHLRVYDYWKPRVGGPTAYQLARVAYSSEQAYQRLRREATKRHQE